MYALVALLSVLATASFVQAFALRRGATSPRFAGLLTALLYTHYWALFFALGGLVALAWLVVAPAGAEGSGCSPSTVPSRSAPRRSRLASGCPTCLPSSSTPARRGRTRRPRAALVAAVALAAAAAVVSRLGRDSRRSGGRCCRSPSADVTLASGWAAPMVHAGLGEPLPRRAGRTGPPRRPPRSSPAQAAEARWRPPRSPAPGRPLGPEDSKSNVAGASATLYD